MEKKDVNTQPENPHTSVEAPTAVPKVASASKSRTNRSNNTMLIACGATAVIALLVGTGIGVVIGKNERSITGNTVAMRTGQTSGQMGGMQQYGGFGGRGGYGQGQQGNRLTGVVTAVNGSTLTVAGNGSTYSVTTDSSTQWSGATSAAVNDTVMITYSGSGNSLTATSIRVMGGSSTSSDSSQSTGTVNNT